METLTSEMTGYLLELSESSHSFELLNGSAARAELIISKNPHKSSQELLSSLAVAGKGKYGSSFDKLLNANHKAILMHMTQAKFIAYFETKDLVQQEKIIQEGIEILESIHQAKLGQERIKEITVTVNKLITDTRNTLEKLTAKDQREQVLSTLKKVNLLDTQISEPNPKEKVITALMSEIKDEVNLLIGEEKILEARGYGYEIIEKVKVLLEKSDTPTDVKLHFTKRIDAIKAEIDGNDAVLIEELAVQIDRELVEKTDKKIRSNQFAIFSTINNIARIILCCMFKIDGERFSVLLNKTAGKMFSEFYDTYSKSLGRIARLQPSLETFTKVEEAALSIIVLEMARVHNNNDDIDGVLVEMSQVITNLPRVDDELSILQSLILSIDVEELADKQKRLDATKTFLAKVKGDCITALIDYHNITEDGAAEIVNGYLFDEGLKVIPKLLSTEFNKLQKQKGV